VERRINIVHVGVFEIHVVSKEGVDEEVIAY